MTARPEFEALLMARGGRRHGAELIFRCPAHDDNNPSASYNVERQIWICYTCRAGGGHRDLCDRLGLSGSALQPLPDRDFAAEQREEQRRLRRVDMARQLWSRREPAAASPVEAYLAGRAITVDLPPTIAYLPDALHAPTRQRLPCMLAAVCRVPDRRVVAVHRTYLKPDGSGKADVEPSKAMLGPVKSAAVRLAPAGERLAIAEGIETALSILQSTDLPVWAGLSASGIEDLILPPLPLASEVVLCSDNDPRGLQAADVAAERFSRQGRRVWICAPPDPGSDFNDLLLLGAAA